ncbi:hypothetical protein C5167_012131 [Papaver somniferum]|uniref:Uncharacterized protein n=1 Tax=Papaver somniferum TaxID=3469 RepID=A0A4Y7J0J7_PAPSO|nr:hypothetical protein C5167_012131 [Papaver somniferum]
MLKESGCLVAKGFFRSPQNLDSCITLPELFFFHQAQPAVSCTGDSGSVSYLEQVVSPIYETMVKTTKSSFVEHQPFEVFTDLFLVLAFQAQMSADSGYPAYLAARVAPFTSMLVK